LNYKPKVWDNGETITCTLEQGTKTITTTLDLIVFLFEAMESKKLFR
jgi:hypothetical protein